MAHQLIQWHGYWMLVRRTKRGKSASQSLQDFAKLASEQWWSTVGPKYLKDILGSDQNETWHDFCCTVDSRQTNNTFD